ncbi:hypothetical protein ACF0H5_018043 [Mactra antiquata]
MEVPDVKENCPNVFEEVHLSLKPVKMSTSTPRQPLADLKQIGRLSENVASKSTTPIRTPKPKKLLRTIKPVTLQKGLEEEGKLEMRSNVVSKLPDKMDEIFEEDVELFVTQVLNQCVLDMNSEKSKDNNVTNVQTNIEGINVNTGEVDKCIDNGEVDKCIDNGDNSFDEDVELSDDNISEVSRQVQRHDFVSQFGDVSLNEDVLLNETNHLDIETSLDSTKSDEELLASYVHTPCINSESSITNGNCVKSMDVELPQKKKPLTPVPTFLQKVALMQRVQDATSNLANWVFPSGLSKKHVQEIPSQRSYKVVQDIACSPMPEKFHKQGVDDNVLNSVENGDDFVELEDLDSDRNDVKMNNAMSTNEAAFKTNDSKHNDVITGEDINGCEIKDDADRKLNIPNVSGTDHSSNENKGRLSHNVVSTACSPMIPSVCDISIQNEVEIHSAHCLPIQYESHEKSTQSEVDMRSTLTSPVRFLGHDVSVQNVTEMHSMMCSPIQALVHDVSIQNKADMQSVMCSPMRISAHDVSVQNVVKNQSIMCSPMVPCPSVDKSVLVSGPEYMDNSVMTDEKICHSISTEAKPETIDVSTEMDDLPMLTTGTSMTPLKIDKKHTKKLTAEDVRKQHPRVLANEFETLRLSNARLESQVHNLEKDRKKLVGFEELQKQFTEKTKVLQELEHKYETEMLTWQQKCDTLEYQLESLKNDHDHEITKVRAEYESNDYREHFYTSQKLVQELKAELDQYLNLADEIDSAKNLQTKMYDSFADSFSKVKNKMQWIQNREKEVEMKDASLKEQLLKYSEDIKLLETDKLEVQNERDHMTQMIAKCKESMLELDSQLKRTKAELLSTEDTVLVMREENDSITKERDIMKHKGEELTSQNVVLQAEVNKLKEDLQTNESLVKELENKLEDVNKRLTETIEKQEKEEASYKDSVEKKKLLIRNLERTLVNRETEIDSQDKELFECREEIYRQMEDAKMHEIKEKELTKKLILTESELNNLKDCCAKLRAEEQDARSSLSSTLEELSYTQKFATDVIRKQGTEIIDTSVAIDELIDSMMKVLSNLRRKAGIEEKSDVNEECTSTENSSDLSKNTNSGQSSCSLVSQILSAVSSTDDEKTSASENINAGTELEVESSGTVENLDVKQVSELKDNSATTDSPNTLSRKRLGSTQNSAFAPVHSLKQNGSQVDVRGSSNSENAKIQDSSKKTMKKKETEMMGRHFSEKVESQLQGVRKLGDEVGLTRQLERVTELFTETMRVAYIIEKALRSSLNDVTFDNEDLSSRVSQCEYSENRLRAELDLARSELEKNKTVIEELNQRILDMSDRFEILLDQDAENKRLSNELSQTKKKYQSIENERDLLNAQITELLRKMETLSADKSSPGIDIKSEKEIFDLKKKLDRYRCMITEKDDQIEQMACKASNRIQKLENNWKKADAEVCRFDELVDVVRSILVNHELVMKDEDLASVVKLIDGQMPLSSFKKERQEDLKPIKTMKW